LPLLSAAGLDFVTERHLATLTTLRADGRPHVTPVGFTWDDEAGRARVICSGGSQKATNVRASGTAVLCQFEGRRWLTLEGDAAVLTAPDAVADAEARYARRYRVPRENPARVVLEIRVTRALGSTELLA
jgi:PPOX class probable F420-dependent enzyme